MQAYWWQAYIKFMGIDTLFKIFKEKRDILNIGTQIG